MTDSSRGDRRSRFLAPDEIELWTKVTADVRPSPGRSRRRAPEAASATSEKPAEPPRRKAAPKAETKPPAPQQTPAPADLDHRTRTKLRRGRIEVEAKLDLHGLRQAEAQSALIGFLRRAQAGGARMAIVVTGKGSRNEEGGVLRRLVPLWLQGPSMRDLVVGFGEAARHHGGEGALYVQIRRAGRRRGGEAG
jgi:DNA-nicking Smr family endonuclease